MTKAQEYLTEQMQEELHKYAEFCMKDGKMAYQDVVAVFLMMKISQLQIEVDKLEQKVEDLENYPASEFPRGQK